MTYIVGFVLMLIGLGLGLVGEVHASQGLLIIGGFLITSGFTTVLLEAGVRGSRGDEPPGYIRP